jgi:hypothetical protein
VLEEYETNVMTGVWGENNQSQKQIRESVRSVIFFDEFVCFFLFIYRMDGR